VKFNGFTMSINKTVGALGFLFFFSFGLLSVSFAACDYVGPAGLYQYAKFHHSKRHGLAQAERNDFKRSMLIEDEGLLPKPPQDLTKIEESTEIPVMVPEAISTAGFGFSARISTVNFLPILNL
jgi:hypothetical protein